MSNEDSDKIYNSEDDLRVKETKSKLGYADKGGEGSIKTIVDPEEEADVFDFEEDKSVCVFCGGDKGIFLYMGKCVCSECYNDLKEKYMK